MTTRLSKSHVLARLFTRGAVSPAVRRARRRGFTMIELLVVITIIGVLISSFVVSTARARENARITKATVESRELANAIRLYGLTMMDSSDESVANDPLGSLGLSEGAPTQVSSSLTSLLTKPSSQNNNTVYYRASDGAIRGNRLCDPWGNPYYIRVKKVEPTVDKEEDYVIFAPVMGRHRAIEPMN